MTAEVTWLIALGTQTGSLRANPVRRGLFFGQVSFIFHLNFNTFKEDLF